MEKMGCFFIGAKTMTISFHCFITTSDQKIEYARIQRKIGRVWIGQTVSLSQPPAELRPTKR